MPLGLFLLRLAEWWNKEAVYTSEGKVSALHLLKSVALSSAKTPRSAVPKIISCSVISGVDVTSRLADNSFLLEYFSGLRFYDEEAFGGDDP